MDIREMVVEASKASPPITVGGLTMFGVPLPEVVLLATLLYTGLQMYFLLRDKWWRQRVTTKK